MSLPPYDVAFLRRLQWLEICFSHENFHIIYVAWIMKWFFSDRSTRNSLIKNVALAIFFYFYFLMQFTFSNFYFHFKFWKTTSIKITSIICLCYFAHQRQPGSATFKDFILNCIINYCNKVIILKIVYVRILFYDIQYKRKIK